MKHRYLLFISIISLFIFFTLVGCSDRSDQSVRESVTAPVSLAEQDDNAVILSKLIPGLIVTIEIAADKVSLVDADIMLVPRNKPREDTRGCILVQGVTGKEVTSQKWIPDPEYVVVEKVGMERRRTRSAIFSLPLAKRIDKIVIQLKPNSPKFEFDVTPVISAFCMKYPDQPLCR